MHPPSASQQLFHPIAKGVYLDSQAQNHGSNLDPGPRSRTDGARTRVGSNGEGGITEFLPEFTSRIESRNGVARVALAGELDIATVPILENQLALSEEDGVAVIMLDLRELTFLDCSTLHVLLAARHRARANGHRLVLVGTPPYARRLFALAGTEYLLDQDDAVNVLEKFIGHGRGEATQITTDVVESDV